MDNNDVPRGYRGYHRFEWYLNDPLLRHPVEAIFCFRLPFQTKWIARLERDLSLERRRTATSLPVAFSLQYLPDSENDDIELRANLSVNISNPAGQRAPPRLMEPHSFNIGNHFTYRIVSSIGPDDFDIAIVVYLSIRNEGRILGEFDFEMHPNDSSNIENYLSRHLRRLMDSCLYHDVQLKLLIKWRIYFPHACILDVRWPKLFAELQDPPDKDYPPTLNADISPGVLPELLLYLYTGCIDHFDIFNRPPNDVGKTELFRAMDKYALHHLHLILQPEVRVHQRKTKFLVFRHTKTITIRTLDFPSMFKWHFTASDGVHVDIFLVIYLSRTEDPSFSYSLKFTSPNELYGRVSLEYIRQVGLLPEEKKLVYEQYWDAPVNGEVDPELEIPMQGDIEHLREFIAGGDRVELGQEVRHEFRFVLLLSAGLQSIEITQNSEHEFNSKEESFAVLSHHMSKMRYLRQNTADLHVSVVNPHTGNTTGTYRLHKAIFEVRVPNWRRVIQQRVPEWGHLPDSVSCATMNDAFRIAVHYIYTERRVYTPANLIPVVSDFAERGGITNLVQIMAMKARELAHNERRARFRPGIRI